MGLHNKSRILIAATSSGSGKTLITCGILRLLKQLNMDPVSFKCGPDYIDPMFHRTVLKVDSSNLDSFFLPPEELNEIVDNSQGKIAVIEGVMGIYDGSTVDSYEGSCYSVAKAVHAPVILVVDAKGAGRTIISLIKGILADDDCRLIKGIILNRMSGYYYKKIAGVLEKEIGKLRDDVGLLGFLPKLDGIGIDSRHLGLKMPEEICDIDSQIDTVAAAIKENCDIDKLLEISRAEVNVDGTTFNAVNITKDIGKNEQVDITQHSGSGIEVDITHCSDDTILVDITLAVARDSAFCFYYKENIEQFEKLGVNIQYFSPLEDKQLPDADGILLGGGYPELYLERLSANKSMLESVKTAIDSKIPVLAECGGFMYLHDCIEDSEGKEYAMAGVIQGKCKDTGHLVRFGYITLEESAASEAAGDTSAGADSMNTESAGAGHAQSPVSGIKAHEFHYYDSTNNGAACVARKPDGSKTWECMISDGVSYMGFPHLYYKSKPEFVIKFVEAMRKYHEQFK